MTSKVSSARFFSVLEDRKGNFWFSTLGSGVYYYDGKSFKNYTIEQGLAGNELTDIYEDKTGNIWFGTKDGASRYDGNSFRNFKMKEGLANTTNNNDSTHVSTFDDEVWRHNDINAIVEDKTGKFWFGTRGYVSVYDGKTFTTLTNKDGKPFTGVRSIIEDKKGNIWLGGYDGLWRYDGRTFTNFTQNIINYIYEDKKGNIWTSSESADDRWWVLSRYDEKSLTDKKPVVTEIKSKYKGNKGMLYGILEANDGSIWFGGSDGVYRYDGNTITDFKSKEGRK
ncbi:MAG TPA: two-component regulator propeller domain-containing protein [Mucilaginibacter sp.]|jgi:ligand-binding sensor domain-containing protein|nr:two-component regulator propeller domain-containing protein [Mucilaginibacter sp.]